MREVNAWGMTLLSKPAHIIQLAGVQQYSTDNSFVLVDYGQNQRNSQIRYVLRKPSILLHESLPLSFLQ